MEAYSSKLYLGKWDKLEHCNDTNVLGFHL